MCSMSLRRFVLLSVALAFSECAEDAPAHGDLIEDAKAVIASREQYTAAGNLEGVMTNVHLDPRHDAEAHEPHRELRDAAVGAGVRWRHRPANSRRGDVSRRVRTFDIKESSS
jgi:hypothetical protein